MIVLRVDVVIFKDPSCESRMITGTSELLMMQSFAHRNDYLLKEAALVQSSQTYCATLENFWATRAFCLRDDSRYQRLWNDVVWS